MIGAVRDVVDPALARYVDALRGGYLEATRDAPGSRSAPGGAERYRVAIRAWTSLDLDPAELHQVGLDELAAIDLERQAIAAAAGFDTVAAYRAHLVADPANHVERPDELVARATEDIERAMAEAPRRVGGACRWRRASFTPSSRSWSATRRRRSTTC